MEKVYIHLEIAEDLKEELKKEAKDRGLSLNSYVRMIIYGRGK